MDLYLKCDFWGNCTHVMLRQGEREWIVATEATDGLARQAANRLVGVYAEAFGITLAVAA